MKVIGQAIGRGKTPEGLPRAHWKPVRRLAAFAVVALALILGAGALSPAHASDIAVVGVIGAVVGFFILRMIAQAPRRTYFQYSDGSPAYPNASLPPIDDEYAWEHRDNLNDGDACRDLAKEMAWAASGLEPYATKYGFDD